MKKGSRRRNQHSRQRVRDNRDDCSAHETGIMVAQENDINKGEAIPPAASTKKSSPLSRPDTQLLFSLWHYILALLLGVLACFSPVSAMITGVFLLLIVASVCLLLFEDTRREATCYVLVIHVMPCTATCFGFLAWSTHPLLGALAGATCGVLVLNLLLMSSGILWLVGILDCNSPLDNGCHFGLHSWDACECVKCSKSRDRGHRWIDGECTCCGKIKPGSPGDKFSRVGTGYGVCRKCGRVYTPYELNVRRSSEAEVMQQMFGISGSCLCGGMIMRKG